MYGMGTYWELLQFEKISSQPFKNHVFKYFCLEMHEIQCMKIFVLDKCACSNFHAWPVRLSPENISTKDIYVYLLRMDYSFLHQHLLIIYEITTNFFLVYCQWRTCLQVNIPAYKTVSHLLPTWISHMYSWGLLQCVTSQKSPYKNATR